MTRPVFAAFFLALLPVTAFAGTCDESLAAAQRVAARDGRLDAGSRTALIHACGSDGVALMLETWIGDGRCDLAAQVGRAWLVEPGVESAVASADQCLAEQVAGAVRDVEERAERRPAPADANKGDASAEPMADELWSPPPAATPEASSSPRAAAKSSSGVGRGAQSRPQGGTLGPSVAATGSGRSVASPRVIGRLSFTIFFDYDSANLRPEALATLASVAEALAGIDGSTQIEVVGHTDSTGGWDYNHTLSEARARTVVGALRLVGVRRALQSRGEGEADPTADNGTEEGRARNRRVEFRFSRDAAWVAR